MNLKKSLSNPSAESTLQVFSTMLGVDIAAAKLPIESRYARSQ